jgi:hypothetical protein
MTSVDRRHRLAVAGKTNEKMSFDWPLCVCVATTQQAATTLPGALRQPQRPP